VVQYWIFKLVANVRLVLYRNVGIGTRTEELKKFQSINSTLK
jgi:hypothetical protein